MNHDTAKFTPPYKIEDGLVLADGPVSWYIHMGLYPGIYRWAYTRVCTDAPIPRYIQMGLYQDTDGSGNILDDKPRYIKQAGSIPGYIKMGQNPVVYRWAYTQVHIEQQKPTAINMKSCSPWL